MPMDDELLFRSAISRVTPQEEEWLAAWLAESAANAERFRDVVDVLLLSADADDELTFGGAPSGEELVRENATGKPALFTHERARRAMLLAAAVVATLAVGMVAQHLSKPQSTAMPANIFGSAEFVTETEPATVGLRDGTVVRLARESRLRVHDGQHAREVSLVGRGYFAVARDQTAPFTIRSDAGTVTVVGTRFDLTVTGEDLRLIVIEGHVRLAVRGAEVEVGAGQMAQVLKGNLVPPITVPDPESLLQWVGNFIVFQDTPLEVVAREIEQRHGIRMELSNAELKQRTVTVFFAGRSLKEITDVICVVAHLRCEAAGTVLKISPAQ